MRCFDAFATRTRAVLACLIPALLLAAAGCGERTAAPKAPVGSAMPDLPLVGLMDGRPVSLARYRGTPLIVNFWATWCEPCRKEMPSLERLSEALGPRAAVLGVTLDTDLNLAREFVLQQRIGFATLGDPGATLSQAALGIRALPETILVDGRGRIAARVLGAREWDGAEARAAVGAALGVAIGAQ